MTRRQWISFAAAGAGSALAYPTLVEPRWLELTATKVSLKLPGNSPIKILHLSDFHASTLVPQSLIDHAITIGLGQRPDLICLTGDFITDRSGFDPQQYSQSLKRLTEAAPTYAVLGNHDGGRWAPPRGGFADHRIVEQILTQSRIRLLHNRCELIRTNGRELLLAGVGDLWSQEIRPGSAFPKNSRGLPTILLSHNPDSKSMLRDHPWHLMLCGHTHGGQVIVPFVGPRYAPVSDKRFVSGLKKWQNRFIYITRGVGSLGSIRFHCRPEVSILDLV